MLKLRVCQRSQLSSESQLINQIFYCEEKNNLYNITYYYSFRVSLILFLLSGHKRNYFANNQVAPVPV